MHDRIRLSFGRGWPSPFAALVALLLYRALRYRVLLLSSSRSSTTRIAPEYIRELPPLFHPLSLVRFPSARFQQSVFRVGFGGKTPPSTFPGVFSCRFEACSFEVRARPDEYVRP